MTAISEEVQLDRLIAATDRGTLWRVPGGGIVRVIDPRFCDSRFRQSLARLREAQHPSMLAVAGQGWLGVHFYIEYRVDSPWETLQAHFDRLHWRLRLPVLRQICAVLPEWSSCSFHPLGLNGSNVVMLNVAGRWFPWLLPCPAVQYSSPCDLFGCDARIVSTLAPELVRGVPFDYRAEDSYALGALALQALGGKESAEASGDEQRVEAQARNALLALDPAGPAVEPFLQGLDPVKHLLRTAVRYTQTAPLARPVGAAELQKACEAAFAATDPVRLAAELAAGASSREALRVLDWGFQNFGETLEGRVLAAEICEKLEELPLAVRHLDRAVPLAPGDLALRMRRGELRWLAYSKRPPLAAGQPDPEGDALLEDLALAKNFARPGHRTQPYLRAAGVYRRRNDLAAAAGELYEAAELEPSDMVALFLYGQCLRDLGDQNGAAQVVEQAGCRLERMVLSEMMKKAEANLWREQFASLLQR